MPRLPEGLPGRALLAALLGGSAVLGFAPFELFWLLPLVLLALFQLLRAASGGRAGFVLGGAFGLAFFLVGVSWVYVSLSVFGGMPAWFAAIATLLYCAVLALLPALLGATFKRWQPTETWRQALFFGALWTLADWGRGWLFSGFPWLALGYAQTPPSPLAGFAPLLGVYGLSWLSATAAALLAVRRRGVVVLLLLLGAGYGLQQIAWTTPQGTPLAVALVQGNVPQDIKWQPEHFVRTLSLYRELVAQHPAQLTVLPETAVPAFFDQLPPEFVDEMTALAQRQQGNLILGAATGEGERYWNSAISLGSAPSQVYRKVHLVPFGEMIPPGFSWFLQVVNMPMAEFSRGPLRQAPMALSGQKVAANICYEDAFGEEIIRALPEATLLVNLSNTAWFGRSLAQPQHLQISRLRALEAGRPMLRATNTGMTAIINPDGQVQAALPPFSRGVLQAEVRGYAGMTPFAYWGNGLALGLAGLSLLAALWPRRQKQPTSAPPPDENV